MTAKSEFLQIRVTPRQKAMLKRAAAALGEDVSTYVLARAIPAAGLGFKELLRRLENEADHRFVLAELNDFLSVLAPAELRDAVADADMGDLSPLLGNYVAAMVEQASEIAGIHPPAWASRIAPLVTPHFATPMRSLRLHLLRAAPIAFKRRNIFIDASIGARV